MNMHKKQRFALGFTCASALLCFAGCDLFSKKKEAESKTERNVASDEVILMIDGQPVLTEQDYEDYLQAACEMNPQLSMLLDMMPNAEEEFIVKNLETAKKLEAWGKKHGVDKKPEFKRAQKQGYEVVDLNLYMKAFEEAHPINISDKDVENYYEKNKDTLQGLKISDGGVQVEYVRFDGKDKAQDFLEKAKEVKSAKAFKDMAEKENLSTSNETINDKSNYSDKVKETILGIKKFPSARLVDAGEGHFWVVFATGKVDAKYHDLNEPGVKDGLKKYMTDERKQGQLEESISELGKEMSIVENHSYFKDKAKRKQEAMAAQAAQASEHNENNMNESSATVKA